MEKKNGKQPAGEWIEECERKSIWECACVRVWLISKEKKDSDKQW